MRIAVAVIHGAGTPDKDFARDTIAAVSQEFERLTGVKHVDQELIFEPVYWSEVFAPEQEELWGRLKESADLDYTGLRRFVIEFLADAVAYQPAANGKLNYDKVHAVLAAALNRLRKKAGPDAPLCVIAHSLGSIVAGNYFYDLQHHPGSRSANSREDVEMSPLERCHTLSLFYTLGSPMALWTLRYIDFGLPITIPTPAIYDYYPSLEGEWVNFYDKDDVLAFPLKAINEAFEEAVTEDIAVNAGGLFTSWNPLAHLSYDRNKQVAGRIAYGLAKTWRKINGKVD
ncbi:chemotaxis protein [Virgibacillus sediminis]|uniref:Chemotaxis protein n=1 Tax=Virgibacillus sediminis TaxID=202260 RepID=A0ABV7A919_9BACI